MESGIAIELTDIQEAVSRLLALSYVLVSPEKQVMLQSWSRYWIMGISLQVTVGILVAPVVGMTVNISGQRSTQKTLLTGVVGRCLVDMSFKVLS